MLFLVKSDIQYQISSCCLSYSHSILKNFWLHNSNHWFSFLFKRTQHCSFLLLSFYQPRPSLVRNIGKRSLMFPYELDYYLDKRAKGLLVNIPLLRACYSSALMERASKVFLVDKCIFGVCVTHLTKDKYQHLVLCGHWID